MSVTITIHVYANKGLSSWCQGYSCVFHSSETDPRRSLFCSGYSPARAVSAACRLDGGAGGRSLSSSEEGPTGSSADQLSVDVVPGFSDGLCAELGHFADLWHCRHDDGSHGKGPLSPSSKTRGFWCSVSATCATKAARRNATIVACSIVELFLLYVKCTEAVRSVSQTCQS